MSPSHREHFLARSLATLGDPITPRCLSFCLLKTKPPQSGGNSAASIHNTLSWSLPSHWRDLSLLPLCFNCSVQWVTANKTARRQGFHSNCLCEGAMVEINTSRKFSPVKGAPARGQKVSAPRTWASNVGTEMDGESSWLKTPAGTDFHWVEERTKWLIPFSHSYSPSLPPSFSLSHLSLCSPDHLPHSGPCRSSQESCSPQLHCSTHIVPLPRMPGSYLLPLFLEAAPWPCNDSSIS